MWVAKPASGTGDRAVATPVRSRPRLVAAVGLAVLGMAATLGPQPALAADDQLSFGVQMARRGLWSEALFRFRQAHRAEPGNARILNNLAVAYEAVGQFDKALEAYQQALKVEPGNRELRRNYARFVEFYQAFRPEEEDEDEAAGEGDVERPPGVSTESSAEDGPRP